MPPIVAPGVLSRIRANPGGFVLQAQGADPDTAAAALARAREDLWSLDAGPGSAYGLGPDDSFGLAYVSEVVPCPSGPFLYIDGGGLPDRILLEIPQILVRRLEEAGLTDAVVISPAPGGPLDDLADVPRGVVLHLLPPPVYVRRKRAVMPEGWLDEVTAWLEAAQEDTVWVDLRGVQVEITIKAAGGLLRACRRSEQGCLVVVGDSTRAVVGASTHHGIQSSVVLGAGGVGTSDAELLEAIERLKDVARRLAPELGYAFIAVEPRLFALVSGHPLPDWSSGLASADVVSWACDRLVLDAFCWQVLGQEHLARLEAVPVGVQPLDGGRVELAIGEPTEWLPGRPERAGLVAKGRRDVLAGCLVDGDEAFRLVQSLTTEPRR